LQVDIPELVVVCALERPRERLGGSRRGLELTRSAASARWLERVFAAAEERVG